jgi:hypothetical protein
MLAVEYLQNEAKENKILRITDSPKSQTTSIA